MKLASRTTRITPSPTLQLSATVKAMVAQGQRVFDFTAGEPSFDSPDAATQAAINAIQAGFTKYTAVTGIDELKDAIIEKFQRDQGLPYSRSQIVVSCGAKHTLFNLALALFEVGDEVIIPSPYWVSYPEQVLVADATPVFLPTSEANNFAIDISASIPIPMMIRKSCGSSFGWLSPTNSVSATWTPCSGTFTIPTVHSR